MQCAMCVLYTYNVQCMHNARKDHVLPMRLKRLTLLYALTPMGTNALEMQVQLGWSLKINLLRELHLAYNTAKYLNFIFFIFSSYPTLQTLIAPDYTTHPHIIHKLHPYSAILLIEFSQCVNQAVLYRWRETGRFVCWQHFLEIIVETQLPVLLVRGKWWHMTHFIWVTMHYTDYVALKKGWFSVLWYIVWLIS